MSQKLSEWDDKKATGEEGNLQLGDISIEDLFPDGCVVMAGEPLAGVTAEEMRGRVRDLTSIEEIVDTYAATDNKFWYLIDEYDDYEPESEEYRRVKYRVDEWKHIMKGLEEKVVAAAQREGLLAPRDPKAGLMRQLEPFMEKYGYRDGNGWWVKSEKR